MRSDLKGLLSELKDIVYRLECHIYSDTSRYVMSDEDYRHIVDYTEVDEDDGYPD